MSVRCLTENFLSLPHTPLSSKCIQIFPLDFSKWQYSPELTQLKEINDVKIMNEPTWGWGGVGGIKNNNNLNNS